LFTVGGVRLTVREGSSVSGFFKRMVLSMVASKLERRSHNPLVNGLLPRNVAILAAATVIFLILALIAFSRRDLRV